MRSLKLMSLMMVCLVLSVHCDTKKTEELELEPDWTELNAMIDDSLKKDPAKADDEDISGLMSPEEEALLDDPNTPQEEKDRILEKVRQALEDLMGDLPERLDELTNIQGDIEKSYEELQQSQAEAQRIREELNIPDDL